MWKQFKIVSLSWLCAFALLALAPVVPPLDAVDTRPTLDPAITVELQQRREWIFAEPAPTVTFDNTFSGARLNACTQVGPHDYKILITPENQPINPSPWYAFRVQAAAPTQITLRLVIAMSKSNLRPQHPQVSNDGVHWSRARNEDYAGDKGASECVLKLTVNASPTWVASHQMVGIEQLRAWTDAMALKPCVTQSVIGYSTAGRALTMLQVNCSAPPNYVMVIGRQHPPEVAGSLGLMAFMQQMLGDSDVAKKFRAAFRVAVVPLVNPDGVHEGQWRSTLGAVDNNRDWHDFSQPESRAVRDAILQIAKQPNARIFLLLDFHATNKDIFYLPPDDALTFPPHFAGRWVQAMQQRFPEHPLDFTGSHNVDQCTFKRWAYETTGAPGITYEIGGETPNEWIEKIASAAADEAMTLLLESADAPRSDGPFPSVKKVDAAIKVKPQSQQSR